MGQAAACLLAMPTSRIGALIGVPFCSISDPANVPGEAVEDGPSAWDPASHVVSIWGMNQQADLSVFVSPSLCFSAFQINK